MSEKKTNTIVVLEPSAKSAKELLSLMEEKGLANVIRASTIEEALQLIAQSLPCMFVASINENGDVPTRVQLFKRLEGAIKQQGLKIFVVTPIKNRQLSDMVTQKLGVADYIVEPVPIRTMQFKANLQLKAVDNFRRQQELKKAAAEAVVIKKLDNGKKQEGPAGNEVKTNGKPALQAGEDTFLFKNSGVKKTGKKYTVELEGPAPETGEWVPHEDKGDPTPAWRWVPNEEKEAQAKGELPAEGWVHKGDKPQFNDESKKWAMTSEKPSLALRQKGKIAAEKVGTDEAGEVFVAEDSAAAEENLAKNRAKAALLKPKKEKKSLKDLLNNAEADDSAEPSAMANASSDTAATDPTAQNPRSKIRPKDDKLGALKNLLGDGIDENTAGELHDKRSDAPDNLAPELKDQRGEDEAPSAFNDLKASESEESPSQGALAFLKKKKEEQKRPLASQIKGDPLPEGVNPLEESDDDPTKEPAERALKRKKKKSPSDALARLAQSLKDGEGAEGEESAEALEDPASDGVGSEEEKISSPRAALRSAKTRDEQVRAEALREDPASERGELNDRQSSGGKKDKLLRERKRSVAAMQALLDDPIAETMSPEEEAAAREELGLKGRPEITPKELSRKRRLKKAKEIKNRLAELDAELSAEEGGEAVSGGIRQDESDPAPLNKGDLSEEKLRGIRGAYDNAETAEELEEERKRIKAKHEAERKKSANKDKANYIPEADIQPIGNAWESSGTHYVYLDSTVRYKGFDKLEDLLPLWIFEGDDAPALLDKTKQWRFLGGFPEQAQSVADIPAPVRDFLIGLRDQIASAEGSGKKQKKNASPDDLEISDAPAVRKEKGPSRLDQIKAMLEAGDEEGARPHSDEEISSRDGQEKSETESEEISPERPEKREKSEAESKFDRLKALLGDEEGEPPSGDSGSKESNKEEESNADPLERLRAKLEMAEESKENYSDKLGEQPGLQSEGVQKFLEKRKKKAEEAAAAGAPSTRRTPAPAPGYLGVFVSLSDAYANQANPSLALSRVLGSLQDSFKNCVVYCTGIPDSDGMAEVGYYSPTTPPSGEKISLAGGLSEAVQRTTSNGVEVLGYLYIGAQSPRESFTDAEETTFRSMATKIWPLLSQAIASNKEAA